MRPVTSVDTLGEGVEFDRECEEVVKVRRTCALGKDASAKLEAQSWAYAQDQLVEILYVSPVPFSIT